MVAIAIHETLLTGDTDAERLQNAKAAGFAGVAFDAAGLGARTESLLPLLRENGLKTATVHTGFDLNVLHPDIDTRQAALDELREALTYARDLEADTVTTVPHNERALGLPDLMPFRAPIHIAVELMTWHLRGYSDLAYVFDLKLLLHPVNRYQSAFLNTLAQGVELRRRIKFNEYVLLAADTFHMQMGEANPVAALTENAASVHTLFLTDNHGGLPGTGVTDFAAIAQAAPNAHWAVVRGDGLPEAPSQAALVACVGYLRGVGFGG
jgi:sugar phosphate isomerase/epimerase